MTQMTELTAAVERGDRGRTVELTNALLESGATPLEIVDNGLIPAMSAVGERFRNGEAFVPEMLIAARAMKESMTTLEPLMAAAGVAPEHTAGIGTVAGDLHDLVELVDHLLGNLEPDIHRFRHGNTFSFRPRGGLIIHRRRPSVARAAW